MSWVENNEQAAAPEQPVEAHQHRTRHPHLTVQAYEGVRDVRRQNGDHVQFEHVRTHVVLEQLTPVPNQQPLL